MRQLEFPPGQMVSAERCGECHKDIYSAWRGSLHARSYTNAVFQASYAEAVELTREKAKRTCNICHAPASVVTDDHDLQRDVTREGVTCDFCHSLTETHLLQVAKPFEVKLGKVKWGPVRDASPAGHDVAFSEYHTSSLQCAGCHEYQPKNGTKILTTYSEWESYREKGGAKSCQECHMPVIAANIVDPKVKRVQGAFVNLHSMPGGHSLDQLTKSLRMRIIEVQRSKAGVALKVKVSNTGAGHAVPTGLPTRKLVLSVAVESKGKRAEDERVYQRLIVDDQGQAVRRDSQVFTGAYKIASDTRIMPFEHRVETFSLPAPREGNVEVTAKLTYFYSPHDRKQTETRVDFWQEKRQLVSEWKRGE
jgi:hypothetical protein